MLLVVGSEDAGPLEAGLFPVRSGRAHRGEFSWFGRSLHGWLRVRGAARAGDRILQLDAIMFQSRASCPVKFDLGFFENRHRRYQIEFSQRKITLGREGLIARSRAQILLFFRDVEAALR